MVVCDDDLRLRRGIVANSVDELEPGQDQLEQGWTEQDRRLHLHNIMNNLLLRRLDIKRNALIRQLESFREACLEWPVIAGGGAKPSSKPS